MQPIKKLLPLPMKLHTPKDGKTGVLLPYPTERITITLRIVLGNNLAVQAARAGNTHPWPDGAVLCKVVWKDTELANWKAATAPGTFVHAEFMFKNSKTYGWGWAGTETF